MKNRLNKLIVITCSTALLMLVAFVGCKTDNVTDPTSSENNLYAHNVGLGLFCESSSQNVLTDNSLVISSAKLVMRQLRMQVTGSQSTATIRDDPFVVYIDLYPRVAPIAVAKVVPGNYHMIKFQIHKPTSNDNISDPEFIGSNGHTYSFIIKGFYNGTQFTYKSQLTAARGVVIEGNPAFVQEGTILYITLRINPYSWFDRGGDMMNPLDEGNRHDIDNNIKDSFKRAFRDLDRNGQPD